MRLFSTKIRIAFCVVLATLFVRVLGTILYEYRWYFPADFDNSDFLLGRRETFGGLYSAAFYTHIVTGPVAVVLGVFQVVSGKLARRFDLHRQLGKVQTVVVILVSISGFIMAGQAFSGVIAGLGFAAHALATGYAVVLAAYRAATGAHALHRRWAGRCFVLLCSPLLLRIVGGFTVVTQVESSTTYRLNAWLSWSIPLLTYEVWCRWHAWQDERGNHPLVTSRGQIA